MTEQRPQSGESNNIPEVGRQNVITTFKNNFDAAIFSEERSDTTVINLSFVPDRKPLEVSYFLGIEARPFKYGDLDKDFISTIEPHLKYDKAPTAILNDSFKLNEFKHMPPVLRRYLGVKVQTTSAIFDLVDTLDGRKSILSQTRYLCASKDNVINIAEIWRIQYFDQDDQSEGKPTFGRALLAA